MLKLEEQINQLAKAVSRLGESLALPKTDIVRDSAIQRFEFCLDLSWKTLKTYLEENKGIIVKSPKETFRIAYQQGVIEYDTKWLSLVDLRNETVHTYNEAFAEEVYNQLSPALDLLKTLSSKLNQR
ncbi:nucleotidyltransferase [Candidatus Collierbacteria bacterium RIFOXYD1_FULL_40_9]|uniref:Nucleotidyltransferase n=1 Tax=Candidatus Collierbacteria bacterium RIFOXYD1_FULL_40_9 TaxID=1817731 RepID=A0A1F5FW63_9BACT|nr:MAG: nucleotidyltransferase [Candidatus Collierbacteria bacterium RIFOXYD1_FULL_40_9]